MTTTQNIRKSIAMNKSLGALKSKGNVFEMSLDEVSCPSAVPIISALPTIIAHRAASSQRSSPSKPASTSTTQVR